MKSRLFLALVLTLALMAAPCLAQAETAETLEFEKIDVAAYDKINLQELYGVNETVVFDKVNLLAVFMEIKPPWTDTVNKVSVNSKEIQLTSGIDTYGLVGYFDFVNQFRFISMRSLSVSRPYKWKEKSENIKFNLIFAVPKDKKSFELKLGDLVTKIEAPDAISPPPNPADLVDIEVVGGKLHDQVRNEYLVTSIRPNPLSTLLIPGGGKILQVKVRLTPKQPNTWKEYFYVPNLVFTAQSDSGAVLAQLGQGSGKKINKVSSNNIYQKDGKWSTSEANFYFAAPPDIKSFKIYYFGQEVGEGKIQ